MTPAEIDETLERVEGLANPWRDAGYRRAVAAAKRDPAVARRYGARIAALDDRAFHRWARLVLPLGVGTALAVVATVIGVGLWGAAATLAAPWDGLALLAGTGVLVVSTHGLGHLAVGAVCGIRFTAWFVGRGRPQPGVKIDYASYLLAPARCRAWMHAAGALVTKLVPVVALLAGWAAAAPGWSLALLAVLAVVQVVTDVTLSTKTGDWSKFLRERRVAAAGGQRGASTEG